MTGTFFFDDTEVLELFELLKPDTWIVISRRLTISKYRLIISKNEPKCDWKDIAFSGRLELFGMYMLNT